jgi:hypothetical protein
MLVIVADLDAEMALDQILRRHQSLSIRSITFKILRYLLRDAGCRGSAHEFARPFINLYQHVLVVFDREGCGAESQTAESIENEVEKALSINGWEHRSAAIVLDPELEIWIWNDSPHVGSSLGWKSPEPIPQFLARNGHQFDSVAKPNRPKEARDLVLRASGKNLSASIYRELAGSVSLSKCRDRAFVKLRGVLQGWFTE